MQGVRYIARLALGLVALLPVAYAHAAELLVWSAGAAQVPMSELVRAYQGTSGNTVNQYIAGDIVTQDKITDSMHRGLLMKSSRNYSTGIK